MKIRDADPSDRDAIVTLDPVSRSDPSRVPFIERSLETAVCIVAEAGSGLVGYAVLEHGFFGHGYVAIVHVSPSHRRQGLGRALVRELASRCRTPKLFTSTNESNAPMRALLESLGFEPSGVIDNLDPGDPELVYYRGNAEGAS